MDKQTFFYGADHQTAAEFFDLFRLSKAKSVVDLSPNTLRAYNRQGLPFHRKGKVVFVSRRELNEFIRNNGGAANEKAGALSNN
jgi:hypothetical protein